MNTMTNQAHNRLAKLHELGINFTSDLPWVFINRPGTDIKATYHLEDNQIDAFIHGIQYAKGQ